MEQQELKQLHFASVVGGAVVTLHGVTSKKWEWWHTLFLITGALSALALTTG